MTEKKSTEQKLTESGPRAARITPPTDFKVSARTLGTRLAFDVPITNISRSGMLLEWSGAKFTLPFIENTLLELDLSTTFRGEPRKMSVMGKVVRRITDVGTLRYGIRIIHTDDQDHIDWVSMVSTFEKTLPTAE